MPSRRSLDTSSIAIRPACPADAAVLTRLAQLDTTIAPEGPVLLAEVDGQPRAALALADGRAIADPFFPTEHLVALLRVRAGRIAGPPERSPWARLRSATARVGALLRRGAYAPAGRTR
jgi:hypothetical protein